MRRPKGIEVGIAAGALGAGVVGGHELKKEAEVQKAEAHRQNALDFIEKLRIMSTTPLEWAEEQQIEIKTREGGREIHILRSADELEALVENPEQARTKLTPTYRGNIMANFGGNLRDCIAASSEWIDTPLAPEILNLLERSVNRTDESEFRVERNNIERLRLEYNKRWGGLQDAFRK